MPDKVACYCNEYLIDPSEAEYVRDGRPMCNGFTCSKAGWHRNQGYNRIPLASLDEANLAAG